MKHILHCLLLGLTTTAVLAEGTRTCRILFLGAPDGAPESLCLYDGTTAQMVELPRMNLSPVYQISSAAQAVQMLAEPPATGAGPRPEAPAANLSAEMTDFYLLVTTAPGNPVAPVSLQVIDANPTKFHKGQMLWFNLTANSVGGKVGSEDLVMPPNSRAIVKQPASGNEDYHVNLTYRMPGKEPLYPLCETKWLHDTRSRSLFFVISEKGSRTPRVLGFSDYRADREVGKNP